MQEHAEKEPYSVKDLEEAFHQVFEIVDIDEPYEGLVGQRAKLRRVTANLIRRYVMATTLRVSEGSEDEALEIQAAHRQETFLLKQLTWVFVIRRPALASQQYGKRKVVTDLFHIFLEDGINGKWRDLLPARCRDTLENEHSSGVARARLAADAVANLSDQEALLLHRRLTGIQAGSVLEGIPL